MAERTMILSPVLDDWPSYSRLIADIEKKFHDKNHIIQMIAVDDGSVDRFNQDMLPALGDGSCIESVSVIRLAVNLGHQRAIATGLASLCDRTDIDFVIVMDSDGEDRPDDIRNMVDLWRANPGHVIVAQRAKRSETTAFKIGYFFYKMLFRILTGRTISFGNFCLLPMAAVRRLVRMSELWNNMPAAIIRSRLRQKSVNTERGVRYAGTSKMNLPSLVGHGLSAMSVYTDVAFVRILLASVVVCIFSIVAMFGVAAIKLATPLAIPGWATTVFGNLLVILIQTLVLIIATTLMILSNRSLNQILPVTDAQRYIEDIRVLFRRAPRSDSGAP